MCLGVPGQVVSLQDDALGMRMGKVSFAGVAREVCLAYVPEVAVGDWVLVHVGFAIQKLDEEEARRTLAVLEELAEAERQMDAEAGAAPSDETPPR